MAAMSNMPKRLAKELTDLRNGLVEDFSDLTCAEENMLSWNIYLSPKHEPFNKGTFSIKVDSPGEYPFKPPKINFKTPIYHPNVDENGQVCLPIIATENWKPATKVNQILNALKQLIEEPECSHPLRAEIAEEYTKKREVFMQKAMEHTLKHGIKKS